MSARSESQRQANRSWTPYGVLAGALLLTGIATFSAARVAQTRAQARFNDDIQQSCEAIQRRLEIYAEMLILGSALYGSSVDVSAQEFRDYVEGLGVNKRYPGVQGIGFAPRVASDQKQKLIDQVRGSGFTNFNIWPATGQEESFPITFLEPRDSRNTVALGFDMASEPVRQSAMHQACDTGAPAASGKVTLVQETEGPVQAGFLIYVPVYARSKIPDNVEQRRRDLIGFVFSPFRAGDFLRSVFRDEGRVPVVFRVYDGPEARPENLLHVSATPGQLERQPGFRKPQQLQIVGRTWTVEFASGRKLDGTLGLVAIPILGAGGLAVSLVLFGLSSAQASAYTAAERNALELRRSQEALSQSEERLRLAVEIGQLGTWQIDPQTRQSRWSQRAARLLGLPADSEVAYASFLSRVLSDDRAALEGALGKALDPGGDGQFDFDFRSVDSDGVSHWLSVRGRVFFDTTQPRSRPERFTGTVLDVTRRKQVEEATGFLAEAGRVLSESLDYKQTLASLARLAVPRMADWCTVDLLEPDGRIEQLELVHLNPEMVELARGMRRRYPLDPELGFGIAAVVRTGRSEIYPQFPDELLARGARDADHLGMLRALRLKSVLLVPIKARNRVFGALSFIFAESGRTYSAEDLPLAEGLALRAGLAVDNARLYEAAQQEILERKRVEDEIQRLNHELEERVRRRTAALQESNEQMEAFTYTVAHDLRAPLRAMHGFSQALLEDCSERLGASGRDYASRVITAAQRMDALIQDLLAYSRLSRSHLSSEVVDLESIIDRVVLNFQPELRAKQALLEVVRPFPRVHGHPNTLELVLTNLISNALKFLAPGVQPQLRVWSETRGPLLRTAVRDNGIGIAADHYERIFRVFERLHGTETFPGTGIGLAIVKKGIERMGGRVGLESEPGEGSAFWFELPLAS